MTNQELEDMLFAGFPPAFWRRFIPGLYLAYRTSWERAHADYERTQERANVIPVTRRGKVEEALRGAADLVPGVTPNDVKAGSWNHIEAEGGGVVLTQNRVPYPCAVVPEANYRATLAESNQLTLWPTSKPDGTKLFAVALHSGYEGENAEDRARHGYLPGSLYVAFPHPDLLSYVHDVNILERFNGVVARQLPSDWDGQATLKYFERTRKLIIA